MEIKFSNSKDVPKLSKYRNNLGLQYTCDKYIKCSDLQKLHQVNRLKKLFFVALAHREDDLEERSPAVGRSVEKHWLHIDAHRREK